MKPPPICSMLVSLLLGVSAASAPAQTTKPARKGPGFVIAVDQQPAESMAGWQAIGINTVLDVPQGHDGAAWKAEADRLGLWQIRAIIGAAADDAKDPLLLAWAHADEPDLHQVPAKQLQAAHDATAALGVPWFVNFDGSRVLGIQGGLGQADYVPLINAAEWIGQDIYPVSGWDGAIALASPFNAYSRLAQWTLGAKPQLIVVGCARQGLPWLANGGRAETKEEFRYFLRASRRVGARGVVLFPLQPMSGFKFDAMPAELKNELMDFADAVAKEVYK